MTVPTEWKETRAQAAAALANAIEHTLAHIQNVEDALGNGNGTVGEEHDPIVIAGITYAGLLKAKISELRAEANRLVDP